MQRMQNAIIKTLLYYDIWHHPLTAGEVFRFLPLNSCSREELEKGIRETEAQGRVLQHQGYYFVPGRTPAIVEQRKVRERHAQSLWRIARLSMHVIRRFPFVRGVFVSGDLSKNVTTRHSDVDFFVITEPDRLWIARTLLILFKKVFLLNSKKYFCLNYFATADHLTLDEQNIFLATEVATLKPLYGSALFRRYLDANGWIHDYFPNFPAGGADLPPVCDRRSLIQLILEFPFRFIPASRLDDRLLALMERTWGRRYPEFDDATRKRIFRCTKTESRAYVGNFQEKILSLYTQRVRDSGVDT